MADRWWGSCPPSARRSFLPWSWRAWWWKDAPAFLRAASGCACSWRGSSYRVGEHVGEQADQPDEDQVDRDQEIQQARQNKDQNPEQQRQKRLNHDDVDMHGLSGLVSGGYNAQTRFPVA